MTTEEFATNYLLDFLQLRRTRLPAAFWVLEDLPDPDCLADATRLAARRPGAPLAHLAVARGPCNVHHHVMLLVGLQACPSG